MSVFFLFVFFVSVAHCALPNGWKTCKKSSPDFNNCIQHEMVNAIKTLIAGDKKLGILSLDPLKFDKMVLPKSSGNIAVDITLTDSYVYGNKGLKITEVKNDWKVLEYKGVTPFIIFLGQCDVEGKVLVLPIVGKGPCNITMEGIQIDAKIYFDRKMADGKEYLHVKDYTGDMQMKRVYFKLSNLFNGNKVLTDNINTVLNDNWEDVVKELRPPIQKALSQALALIANKVFSKIPADEIDIS